MSETTSRDLSRAGPDRSRPGHDVGLIAPVRRMGALVSMVSAFTATLVLAACILRMSGVQEHGVEVALRVTGRLMFLLFWLAYTGGAAAALLGPSLSVLKRHVRESGLAFAAALPVHIGLVIWLCLIGRTPPLETFLLFGIALFWTYLMALLSIERLQRMVGLRACGLIRCIGLNYLAFAFAADFLRVPASLSVGYVVTYLPFMLLLAIGVVLNLVAWLREPSGSRFTGAGAAPS
jgi:hypothetical protein